MRIPIEADAGASSNTVDHFMPAIAADPTTSGATTHLGLYYYEYPLANCQFVNIPADQCSPFVGFVSSTNRGASWSAPQALSTGPPSVAVFPRTGTGNGNPDVGNVLAAAASPGTTLKGTMHGFFPVGLAVDGFDVSMYTPDGGLTP